MIIMIIFNMSTSHFHKISLFWGLFNDETALRDNVGCCNSQWTKYKNCDPFKYYLVVNQVSNSSYWL